MLRRGVSARLQFFLLAAGLTILVFFTTLPQDTPSANLLSHPYFRFNFSAEEPELDHSQLCLIPRIHPFHPSIWRYLTETKTISCTVRTPTLSYIDRFGWLRLNRTALDEAGYQVAGSNFVKALGCYWRPIFRGGPHNTDDDSVTYGNEVPLSENGVPLVDYEVVMVTCRNFARVPVYENIHAHIRNITDLPHLPQTERPPNVLIFGLDSLSRQAFIRLLPKTYRYLTVNLSTYVFVGMNKVGDNTYPNLVALLTGKPAYGSDLKDTDTFGFDDWPLIWRNYSNNGYMTLWAEDFPDYGLFNYLAKGFRRPPVHHYLRPFWLAVKSSSALRSSSHMCFGNVPRHQLQLDYLRRFILKYSKGSTSNQAPYFGFSFLAELSHEYISQVNAADEDFEAFFRYLHKEGHLSNTLMIVLSDHGHRFDSIRATEVGRLEERLPFFGIYVPESILSRKSWASQNIETNRGRLTTPYDIHATLVDFLQFAVNRVPLGTAVSGDHYGRTLFGYVPSNRTCETAGIPAHYCTCEPETAVSVDDLRVRSAVRVIFNRVNKMLRVVRQFCAELFPGTVLNAQLLNAVDNKGSKYRIRVTVGAVPSEAIFEATVEVRTRNSKSKTAFPYDAKVLGDVSRINKYGNQSACIRHDIYRKYCYCQKNTRPPNMSYRTYRTMQQS